MRCIRFEDGVLLKHYHDTERGIPSHSDRLLFGYLMLECMSAGLSWMLRGIYTVNEETLTENTKVLQHHGPSIAACYDVI